MADTFASTPSDYPRPPRLTAVRPPARPTNPYATHLPITPPSLQSIPRPEGIQQALGLPPSIAAPGPAVPDFSTSAHSQYSVIPPASQPPHTSRQFEPQTTWDSPPSCAPPPVARHYPVDNPQRDGNKSLWQEALQTYVSSGSQSTPARPDYAHSASQGLVGSTANAAYLRMHTAAPMQHAASTGLSIPDGVPLAAGADYSALYGVGKGPQSTAEYGEDHLYNNDGLDTPMMIHTPVGTHVGRNGGVIAQHRVTLVQPDGSRNQAPRHSNGLSGETARRMACIASEQPRAAASGAWGYGSQVLPVQVALPRPDDCAPGRVSLRSQPAKGQQLEGGRSEPGGPKTGEVLTGQEGDRGSDNIPVVVEEITPLERLSPGAVGLRVQEATARSVEDIEIESPRASGLDRADEIQTTRNQQLGSQVPRSLPNLGDDYPNFFRGSNMIGPFDAPNPNYSESARRFSGASTSGAEVSPATLPKPSSRSGAVETAHVSVLNLDVDEEEVTKRHCPDEEVEADENGGMREGLFGNGGLPDIVSSAVKVDGDGERDKLDEPEATDRRGEHERVVSKATDSVERQCDASVQDHAKSSARRVPCPVTVKRSSPRLKARENAKRSVLRSSPPVDVAKDGSPSIKNSSLLSGDDSQKVLLDDVPLGARNAPGLRSRQPESSSSPLLTSAPAKTRAEVPSIRFDSDEEGVGTSQPGETASGIATGKGRKTRKSASAAQRGTKAERKRTTWPTRRRSQQRKADMCRGSAHGHGASGSCSKEYSVAEEENEELDAIENGNRIRKRRRDRTEAGEHARRKVSRLSEGRDDLGMNRPQVPQLSFDDDSGDEPVQSTSVFARRSEQELVRIEQRSYTGGGTSGKRKRSVFDVDDGDDEYQENSGVDNPGNEEDDSDEDFEALAKPASKRKSAPQSRCVRQGLKRKESISSAVEKSSAPAQKCSSLRGKTSSSPRKRSSTDCGNLHGPNESPRIQSERVGSQDDETDADTNSPSQGGSQGMNIVVKALPIRKKKEKRYPEHLWNRMTSDELSTIRLGFVNFYPTPPSNMHAQGRFEQQYMREMPQEMIQALWEKELKPWSDRWWKFFMMFGDFAREKKKQKPPGRNPTLNQTEVNRWAKEFHSKHGDARLPAAREEAAGTAHAN